MSHSYEAVTKSVGGAHNNMDTIKMPNYNMMNNYALIHQSIGYITGRSYELPHRWFFLTFKPFNSTYDTNYSFYQNKCIDHCRKKLGKVEAYIITRETEAIKTHVNILCVTTRALDVELHQKKTNRYYIYCQEAICRHDCLKYILKESKTRYFIKYIDYVFHCK